MLLWVAIMFALRSIQLLCLSKNDGVLLTRDGKTRFQIRIQVTYAMYLDLGKFKDDCVAKVYVVA